VARPVKLAVFLEQDFFSGGGYQQMLNTVSLIAKLPSEVCDPVFITVQKKSIERLQKYNIDAVRMPISLMKKIKIKLQNYSLKFKPQNYIINKKISKLTHKFVDGKRFNLLLKKLDIDLVYFPASSLYALGLDQFNYIFTVLDLCHLDYPEFPEIRKNREFEKREFLFKSALPKAVAVVVDSELGKKKVARRYHADEERIFAIPFSQAPETNLTEEQYKNNFIDIKKKYNLKTDYVFYPAQFWAHKNHVYLLHGLLEFEKRYGYRLGAIFSGGDRGGNQKFVKRIAEELKIADRVIFAGFVANEEIPYLYRQSVALVMPTYFGPTNLPPLEAFKLGVPVCYSDLPGLRDQVGDAAMLMDLNDPGSLANNLNDLLTHPEVRKTLIEKGFQRLFHKVS